MKELTSSQGGSLRSKVLKGGVPGEDVVLVGWEVVVMEDWEVVMLVIWVGGRALDDKDM